MREQPRLRADIQAMRGIAVLLVLAYHAFPQAVPAGFIGVDVFFVISGWLITGLIVSAQDEGRFSALAFWGNRAKRLLPAAYATIALTLLGSWLVLAGEPLARLGGEVARALTFTLNFALAGQVNYFSPAAEFTPLLHMWSLSVEEQFYLLLPPLLLLVRGRWRWLVLALVFAASLAVRIEAWRWVGPAESFFLPWTRAWQLALGGLGWMAARRLPGSLAGGGRIGAAAALALVALAGIDLSAVVPGSSFHPGLAACLASALALVLLWLRAPGAWEGRWLAPLRWTGDISYALYLVHWPLLSLWRAAQYDTALAPDVAAALVVASIGLAAALHYAIERPLHRMELRRPALALGLAVACALPLALAGQAVSRGARDWLPDSRSFLDAACGSGTAFAPPAACRTGDRPRALLFGDSLAAHLQPGLDGLPLVRATRPACAPITGAKQRYSGWETDRTARDCILWQASVLDWADRQPKMRLAILGGSWQAAWRSREMDHALLRLGPRGELEHLPYDPDVIVAGLRETVRRLRARGLRVVLVAPPPPPLFDAGMCLAARAQGKWMPLRPDCRVDLAERAAERAVLAGLLQRIEREADVPVFRFEPWLCRAGSCVSEWRGRPLFHDQGHFSAAGFAPFAREIGLPARLEAMAR